MRGLVTAVPITVRGWSLSYDGHQHEAGLQALLGSSPPWARPQPCTTDVLDSTSADRRQEESENCTGQVDVRQQADRRCVGLLCRRGDRRLLACWPADGG